MREQAERRPDMERLRRWAEANPDRAAGHGWDTSAAEAGTGPTRYFIGVVGDIRVATRELRKLLDRPELLDVVPRRFTWTQLCALRDAIVSEYRGKITERGTRITTIGPAMPETR